MRHAFLIIAHHNWTLLNRLIKRLDHPNNDIYIHIDKKSELKHNFIQDIQAICEYSTIKLIKKE